MKPRPRVHQLRPRVHHYLAAILYALVWSAGSVVILIKLGSPVWAAATIAVAGAVTLLIPVCKSWWRVHPYARATCACYLLAATPSLIAASLISAVMLAVGLPGWLAGEAAGSILLGTVLTLIWRSRPRSPL